MTKPRRQVLPPSLPPRGLTREEAAAYIGIGAGHFDKQVAAGRMPGPKQIGGRLVWDRAALDRAFDALPERGEDAAGGARPAGAPRDAWDKVAV